MGGLMKRVVDVSLALVGLILLSPVMAVIAVAITVNMGSPVLFRQVRPGLHGKPFVLYKFRTMRPPRIRDGLTDWSETRTTRLGHVLRKTSLDELPELWNVLRGDMSIVGPRPLLIDYLPLYTPEQARRHEVKPGLTGLAQVKGRHMLEWEERFRLDVWYVDHRSLRLDLGIMVATIKIVLTGRGIPPYSTPENRFTGTPTGSDVATAPDPGGPVTTG
jgi:lipopolysaccharide/colanic/teichoic acid biosynthesis glycosyltransferase